jgi:hypothetical protein
MLPDTDADPKDVEDVTDEIDDGADPDEGLDAEGDDEPGEGAELGGEDDDAGGHEGQTGRSAEVKTGRAKNDFGRLREERREANERAERLARENQELLARLNGRQTEETRRAEQERLSLMTADEKLDYYRGQDRRELEQFKNTISFQLADSSDRQAFAHACDRSPALAAVSDDVERILAQERAAGRPGASREVIARYVIGDRALKNAGRAKSKQQKRATEQRERQTSRAAGARSDVAQSGNRRGSESEQRRKRLEDVNI